MTRTYQVTENAVVTSEFPLKGQRMPSEVRSLTVRVYSDRFITTTKQGNFTSLSGGYIKDGVFFGVMAASSGLRPVRSMALTSSRSSK